MSRQLKTLAASDFGVSSEMPVLQRFQKPNQKMRLMTTISFLNPGMGLSTRVGPDGRPRHVQTFCDAPAMWWSAPGVGKSTMMYEIAQRLGIAIIKIDASEGFTLSVIQVPEKLESGTMVLNRPSDKKIAAVCEVAERGILFVDEVTDMPLPVQVNLMKLIQTGEIGSDTLPPLWRRVAAGNTPRQPGNRSSGTNTQPIKAAPSGRMMHALIVGPGGGAAIQHRLRTYQARYATDAAPPAPPPDMALLEKLMIEKYQECFVDVHSLFVGFSEFSPTCLESEAHPSENGPQRQERTFNYAADILTTIEALATIEGVAGKTFADYDDGALAGMDEDTRTLLEGEDEDGFDIRYTMLAGFVGTSLATDIMAYRSVNKDLPRIADLVDGRVTWTPDRARADRTLLMLEKWTVTLEQMRQPTANQIGNYIGFLGKVFDSDPDFGASYVDRGVSQNGLLRKDDVRLHDFWEKKEQVSRAARAAKRAARAVPK